MQFGILLAGLAVIGGLLYRVRLIRTVVEAAPVLSDDLIRQIEEVGHVEVDEPLDLEQIQEEEARFWEDRPWEDSDEW